MLPFPLDALVCRVDGRPLALVDAVDPLVDHGDLLEAVVAVDLNGTAYDAVRAGDALGSRLAPFMVPVTLTARGSGTTVDAASTMAHTLAGAWLLGTVEAAVDRCVEHVTERHQFGQRIADFQAVQFQVADAVVATSGLAELALFTVWRVVELGAGARTDALALRLHAADVAAHHAARRRSSCTAHQVSPRSTTSRSCAGAPRPGLRSPASPERILDALDRSPSATVGSRRCSRTVRSARAG